MDIQFRPITSDDQTVVWELLRFAAHEDSVESVQSQECCIPYAHNFGRQQGDLGVLATSTLTGQPMGGAWIRLLGEQGMASSTNNEHGDIPELALAVFPEYRERGIGSKLLQELSMLAKERHVQRICLSCRVDNVAAMRLYEKHGFVKIPNSEVTNRVGGTSVSMILTTLDRHDMPLRATHLD